MAPKMSWRRGAEEHLTGRCQSLLVPLGISAAILLLTGLVVNWNWPYCDQFQAHTDTVMSLSFSPDGHHFASASSDKTVVVWSLKTRKACHTFVGFTDLPWQVSYSPDGKLIVVASDAALLSERGTTGASRGGNEKINIYDAATGAGLARLEGHRSSVGSLGFTPDGKFMLSASCDGSVRLWDTARWVPCPVLPPDMTGMAVAVSPDGKLLALGGKDSVIQLWDLDPISLVGELKGHENSISCLAFSPDGNLLASGAQFDAAIVWDVRQQTQLYSLPWGSDRIRAVAFSPDGNTLAASEYFGNWPHLGLTGEVTLWDVPTGRHRASLRGHDGGALAIAFSPDGKTLVTGDNKGVIRFWPISSR